MYFFVSQTVGVKEKNKNAAIHSCVVYTIHIVVLQFEGMQTIICILEKTHPLPHFVELIQKSEKTKEPAVVAATTVT